MKTIIKPEEFRCNGLFETFQLLKGLEKPYLIYMPYQRADKSRLCLIKKMETYIGEVEYAEYPEGHLPCNQEEEIKLVLECLKNGEIEEEMTAYLSVNIIRSTDVSSDRIMKDAGIRLPSREELDSAEFVSDTPVYRVEEYKKPKIDRHITSMFPGIKGRTINYFKNNLEEENIPYKIEKDESVFSFRIVFPADKAPMGHVNSYIHFRDFDGIIRCCYNAAGKEMYEKSEYKSELLRFLNYVNSDLLYDCREDWDAWFPKLMYTPRIYVDEFAGNAITIATVIKYSVHDHDQSETWDYITKGQLRIINGLSPYITGVLTGELTADEAINGFRYRKEPL